MTARISRAPIDIKILMVASQRDRQSASFKVRSWEIIWLDTIEIIHECSQRLEQFIWRKLFLII